jgi:phage terminase large subunit
MPQQFPDKIVKNPFTMLLFYDDDIQSGRVKLDKWQKELLEYLGKEHVYGDPAVVAQLLAANGSGKSQYIIAPFAIWMTMKHPESLTIITTSSGNQLDSQDLRYCTRLAKKINKVHEGDFPEGVIECQYRKFFNKVTESFINLFATDETGKAEGWHPISPTGKFAIIIDEGKTVTDDIYFAIENCTGFSHRLDVSSAGKSSGTFHANWHNNELDSYMFKKRITAFDCSHLKISDIEFRIKKYGLHHPRIRNSVFSEFTSADESVVIPRELLLKSSSLCNKFYDFGPLRAGLDLAAGGDENSISVWKGNKEIAKKSFVKKDTYAAIEEIIEFIKSFKGELRAENIYGDDSGVGRSMLDIMAKLGYKVNRVMNQSRAADFTHYANRGTELWCNFKRFIEEYQVLFMKNEKGDMDPILLSQMSNRYYKTQDSSGKMILESKAKAKAEGHPSPDRADAVILAWCPLVYPVAEMSGPSVQEVVVGPKTIEDFLNQQRMKELEVMRGGGNMVKLLPTSYTPQQIRGMNLPLNHKNIFNQRN